MSSSEKNLSATERAARILREARLGAGRSRAGPLFVEISANNYCNLRCAFCYGAGKPDPLEFVPEEHERLLDELLPGADVVIPSAGSEPFLGDLERTLAAVKRHGNRLLFITSGYELSPEWARRLSSHLYRLQVSLDSHQPETYARLRVGSDFERVTRHLKEAARILAEQGKIHRLVVSAVATSENFSHLPEMIEAVREWGVEVFLIQNLYGAAGKFEHLSLVPKFSPADIAEGRRAIAEAAKKAKAEVMIALPPVERFAFRPEGSPLVEWDPDYTLELLKEAPGTCYQARQWAKVSPDGTVYPCCVAPAELAMGNVREESFTEIYNGKKWRALRRAFGDGRPPEVCRKCELFRQYQNRLSLR